MQEIQIQSLGQEDPLGEGMATHSSILAWKIPWTEEPGGLQSMGSPRVRHDRGTQPKHLHFRSHNRRQLFDLEKPETLPERQHEESPSGFCQHALAGASEACLARALIWGPGSYWEAFWELKPKHTGCGKAYLPGSTPVGSWESSRWYQISALQMLGFGMWIYDITLKKDSQTQVCCGCISVMILFVSKLIWRGSGCRVDLKDMWVPWL